MMDALEIEVLYEPRPYFMPLHDSSKRFIFVCAHRRAGKTLALANHLIRAAMLNKRKTPPPRYAYVGPSFEQTKDLVFNYLKHYTSTIPDVRHLEGELQVILPNGASIRLYGGALSAERIRGIYLDGVVCDEYPLLSPTLFTSILRPALGDYRGFAIISGTPAADDHFFDMKLRAEADPETWDVFEIPITDTGEIALSHQEVEDMRRDMSPAEFSREMLCDFSASVEGAYYEAALNALAMQKRITRVSPDLNTSVITSFDLGISDLQCAWLFQLAGPEVHFIDYIEDKGKSLSYYADLLAIKAQAGGFQYRAHLMPHDVEVRELATGHSRRHELMQLLAEPIITVPQHNPADGITAVRGVLGVAWFDETACRKGLARLRGYRQSKSGVPLHDLNSHGADAMRTGAVGIPLISGGFNSRSKRLRRRLRGLV
jgi:hypothetical protein